MKKYGAGSSETDIQRRILDLLNRSWCVKHVWRNNVGAFKKSGRLIRFGISGMSDVLGITSIGSFFAIEIKKPGTRTKPERAAKQKAFLDIVNDTSLGRGILVQSIDDVQLFIKYELEPVVKGKRLLTNEQAVPKV